MADLKSTERPIQKNFVYICGHCQNWLLYRYLFLNTPYFIVVSQTNPRLFSWTWWKVKGNLSSFCLSKSRLGKSGLRQDPASHKSQVCSFGDTTLPSWLWLSIIRQLFLWYPVWSLSTLSDLAICVSCPFSTYKFVWWSS